MQQQLDNAEDFDEWLQCAKALDERVAENYDWYHDPESPLYHWVQIQHRIGAINEAILDEDVHGAFNLLEFGMVRGLGNIADPRLYNRIYAGTKRLIEEYIIAMVDLLERYFAHTWRGRALDGQQKLDQAENFRIAFGKTALLLQGGSIFGLYHLGVMKAMHETGLLPKVIVGTGTGAIMAALAGCHTDEELPQFLSGQGINLDAFTDRSNHERPRWYHVILILFNRLKRYYQSGYVLDRSALEQCVEDNLGDTTFREARERTGRIISITIECDSPGTPNCLNYLTTPHVLIRTAAMASNETDPDIAPAMIRQKNYNGDIELWSLNDESPAFRKLRRKRRRRAIKDETNGPLQRISQLVNVNHFVISQARPYIVPFLAPSMHRSKRPLSSQASFLTLAAVRDYIFRLIGKEIAHRMSQFDTIWGLPRRLRRFLIDEKIPFRSLTMVPEIKLTDFLRLLRNPTKDEIGYWIALGEKSVWPCVSALEVRCAIEFDLEERYQHEKRRPLNEIYAQERTVGNAGRRRTRFRSGSADSNPAF